MNESLNTPFIDRELYRILKCFTESQPFLSAENVAGILHLPLIDTTAAFEQLLRNGCLSYLGGFYDEEAKHIGSDTQLCLGYSGVMARRAYRRSVRSHFFNEFRAWVTLAIALAAFVLSVINSLTLYN